MSKPIYSWDYETSGNGGVRLVAFDLETGDPVWQTPMVRSRQQARAKAEAWLDQQARAAEIAA
jgi:outer membrane protein assembly factor BamB